MTPGQPWPFGAHWDGSGINFAVFSEHAEAIEIAVFDAGGATELKRLRLPSRSGDVWHGRLDGAAPGLVYALYAHGPWQPDQGHRFDAAKPLLDPCAREIVGDLTSGLKARVTHDVVEWFDDRPPATPLSHSVIYEMHVKGFSKLNPLLPETLRGTYAGLAHPASIAHLKRLGITAVNLLPVHHHLDEERLVRMGLTNYWGYNTIGFFAPDPCLSSTPNDGTATRAEFRAMVRALHTAGIEVILDVVYNHTAETDVNGPTLSFRGLDNASYYRLPATAKDDYVNDTGCGNTVNVSHPRVLQLVMDSLRYWVEAMHVDGFRFDLATVLGRGDAGFDRRAAFFAAVAQDPVLSRVKLIAEPWDIGPGGYQVGEFPTGWVEWNDKFRDDMRSFWTRHPSSRGAFARRLCASSDLYQTRGRAPAESLNYVISHDGFTLRDLVSYNARHNEANGESNRDGTANNLSFNCGAEGETSDADVIALRARLARAVLATTLLAQGTPMLSAGDELGHTQDGNNNPYCQDSPLTWIAWEQADDALIDFTARVIALRDSLRPFGDAWYGATDLSWFGRDGAPLPEAAWSDANDRVLGCVSGGLLLVVNADPRDAAIVLPAGAWECLLDSTHATGHGGWHAGGGAALPLPAASLMMLRQRV